MKKSCCCILSFAACLFATAQSHSFHFFPIEETGTVYQGLAGRMGAHFVLLKPGGVDSLNLYVYDTVSKKGNKRSYPFPRRITSILVHEKSIVFTSITKTAKGMACQYLEIDENGDPIQHKENSLGLLNSLLNIITSPDLKHVLFYENFRKDGDSALLQGYMMNEKGDIEKQLAYIFKHDAERDGPPQVFVDNGGNTHIFVFDQYNNYRISTDLMLNSIAFGADEMISEKFSLEKIKLKSLQVFQNTEKNCIQAEGVFTDAMSKNVQGLFSMSFPPERENKIVPRFMPFTETMLNDAKKGFSGNINLTRNSMQLQSFIHSDYGSFAVFRLASEERNTAIMGAARPYIETGMDLSKVQSRANTWNASKLIYLKMREDRLGIEWHSIKKIDIFKFMYGNYNFCYFLAGEKQEVCTLLYNSDGLGEPYPSFVSIRNGNQRTEKIPGKNLRLFSIRPLAPHQYGALYTNTENGESGILFIESKDQL